jgi:uncharacterized membrane protein YidH (DUF202 family)
MGQQISSDDNARTQILLEETPGQRSCPVLESMPNSVNPSEPASSADCQAHTPNQIASKQSSNEPRNFREAINEFTAPMKLSLVLENKGNVARDHLASERTYLAYVRTSLACASAGVGKTRKLCISPTTITYELTALVQLFTLSSSTNANIRGQGGIDPQHFARPLGATVVLLGLLILVYGESYNCAGASNILISRRPRTLFHDPGSPRTRLLPGGTQFHCCRRISPWGCC